MHVLSDEEATACQFPPLQHGVQVVPESDEVNSEFGPAATNWRPSPEQATSSHPGLGIAFVTHVAPESVETQ